MIIPNISRRFHWKTPTGFYRSAQGCEARATLGLITNVVSTLKALQQLQERRFNPFRVGQNFLMTTPRVARASQPWAEGCNPFGIGKP
jgi:hypothetical protein